MTRNSLVVILIIALALILRFFQLGINPPSLNWDETAHGYNAYSILKTGKDEYGYKLPLSFRSFDDYKPPIYTYLVVPTVAIFGLENFAVRLPSALLGTLAVLFTYLMVYELFRSRKIAMLAAFFLAVSPWHLQFSRVAFETNSAIFLSTLGTWAFLKGIRSVRGKITLWMLLSSFSFGANLFMYHNARVFIPLFAIGLLVLYRKLLLKNLKYLIPPIIVAILFSAVLVPVIFSKAGQTRYQGTSIFGDVSPLFKNSQTILQDEDNDNLDVARVIHNRRLVYVPILVENYLSHFNPNFLFFEADMERHHAPLMGLLYLWELPFLLAGFYFLVRKGFSLKSKIIVFYWLALAPIASSVTWGVPHSLRSEILLPTFQIATAIGIYFFLARFKSIKIFTFGIALIMIANFAFYLHQYYVQMPLEYSESWKFGRKEAVLFTEKIKNNYDQVIVSTKLEQPHEFWLYYTRYDPKKYLEQGGTVSGGFLEDRNKFDKYAFKPIDSDSQMDENTLLVGFPEEIPSDANILKTINYLNGEPAITIADFKN